MCQICSGKYGKKCSGCEGAREQDGKEYCFTCQNLMDANERTVREFGRYHDRRL